jgi:galactose oxidase
MMGVLLQGFYKALPNDAVPSPADGKPGVPWWWDHLAAQARALSLAGFAAVWLPPVLKSASGAKPGADGYGPFDDYDIGSKRQKGSIPTRFGTREDLLRCAAILRANGLDIYLDMVEHHRAGDGRHAPEAFVFRHLGANGTPGIGRFPKDPENFLPQVPRDPHLGGSPADDRPFFRELAPINGRPANYVFDHLIAACDWLTRTVGAQGYRLDDVKGLSTDFLLPFLNSKAMAGKFAVGEFFDGNAQLIKQWIFNPHGMQGRPSAFDFPLKFTLTSMCNNPGRFNMADLDHAGLTAISPLNSVTFVENHDTDLQNSQKVVRNKLLGYAYILTSEGYPSVYYKDYSTDPGCYGLQPKIDNLIWIHEVLASGATQQRWKDFDVFAYERTGGSRLLVALNNDPSGTHTIEVATGFGANVHLKDYTGHSPDVFTDGGGNVTINVPPNVNGLGYVCYSHVGQDRVLTPASHPAVQDIEGALDLDVLPAMNGKTVTAGRIWCAAGTSVHAAMTIDDVGWDANAKVDVTLLAPDGAALTALSVRSTGTTGAVLQANTTQEGFYSLQIAASGLPVANRSPVYKLSVIYSAPQTFVATDSAASPLVAGQWGPVFDLANVAIHAHLLPTGKVLYWGRRSVPGGPSFASLNEHFCSTFLWDPATGKSEPTAQVPRLENGEGVNLFCSGHSFLPDGRLLVVGGHLFDSEGVDQACIYDPVADTWTALPRMNNGRWYPSALTLPDGGVLAISGSFAQGRPQPPPDNPVPPPAGTKFPPNPNPQIWRGNAWAPTDNFIGLQLFPRLHVEPKQGRVFMAGPGGETFFLDTTGAGTWTSGPVRDGACRDYAPSVMYASGKVLFAGGGLDKDTQLPTNLAETIDLNAPDPQWKPTAPMHFRRRQHNATVLPDGSVLVTGGTQGVVGNPGWLAFDNVRAGGPVHQAELWDTAAGTWTLMAEESVDRCYHSVALLLPDGRVLSAGGGEYAPNNPDAPNQPNPAGDSHKDAQLFSPPYLFKGPRPTIAAAPTEITYAKSFEITVGAGDSIAKVSWIRLSSVTHSCNQNQLLNFLGFRQEASKVIIQAPASPNVAPPGHYMLFVLNEQGVPSVGHIARISAQAAAQTQDAVSALRKPAAAPIPADLVALDTKIAEEQGRPPVVVGITPSCPYGIGACWGGAFAALRQLSDVDIVRPLPDTADSIAFVYLRQDTLPDLDAWRDQFAKVANGTYVMRGLEMTISGTVTEHLARLALGGTPTRPELVLAPLQAADKVQWDFATRTSKPMSDDEVSAFARLSAALAANPAGATVQVTGPLKKSGADFFLEVREYEVNPA